MTASNNPIENNPIQHEYQACAKAD